MKQAITTQRRFSRRQYTRLYGLLLLFLLSGLMSLQAQNVSWTTGFPKINPAPLTILDTSYVEVDFSVSANVNNAQVHITLPSGVTRAANAGALSGNTAVLGNTGSTTVPVVSLGNLTTGTKVKFRLPVYTACNIVDGGVINLKIQSGSTTLTGSGAAKDITTTFQKPGLNVNIPTATIDYSNSSDVHTYEINLNTGNGNLNDFKLVFTSTRLTGLKNFKLGTTTIPNNKITRTASGNDSIVTVVFDGTLLSGKLTSTVVTLKLDAVSYNDCGTKTVNINGWFPSSATSAASACGNIGSDRTFTLKMTDLPGVPTISFISRARNSPYNTTANMRHDGSTPMFITYKYENISAIDAYNLVYRASQTVSSASLGNTYIDVNNIFYTIEGEAEAQIPASDVTITSRLSAANRAVLSTYANLPLTVEFTIPDVIPAGKTIDIRVGHIIGLFYDPNSPSTTMSQNYMYTIYNNLVSVTNECGNVGKLQNVDGSYTTTGPVMNNQPPALSVKANQSGSTSFAFRGGAVIRSTESPGQSLELFVKLPSWMTLDDTNPKPLQWIADNMVDTWPNAVYTDLGGGLYKLTVKTSDNTTSKFDFSSVKIFYKTGTCPGTANVTDQIAYWIDYNTSPTGTPTVYRPVYEKIALAYQPVSFICERDGFVLEKFGLIRTTKGYTDLNNDGVPDDASIASNDDIDNGLYMATTDKGYALWKGEIDGASSTSYTNLYAMLTTTSPITITSTGSNNYFVPETAGIVFKVDGVDRPGELSYVRVGNTQCYLKYTGITPLNGGSQIEIRLPFYFRTGVSDQSQMSDFVGECFVSNSVSANPSTNPVNRHGKDKFSQGVQVRTNSAYVAIINQQFTDNNPVTVTASFRGYYANYFSSPWHVKEYWPYILKKGVIVLPQGYEVTDNSVSVNVTLYGGASASSTVYNNRLTTCTVSNDTCFIDLESLFDTTYPESGSVAGGKLQLPDDQYLLAVSVKIRATKKTVPNAVSVPIYTIFEDPRTGVTLESSVNRNNCTFNYSGMASSLTSLVSALSVTSPEVEIPVLTVGNINNVPINNVWLYVEGNVNNISLKQGASTITGTGHEGRWLKIAPSLGAEAVSQYALEASYAGGASCSSDVKIYIVSGYETSWDPETDANSKSQSPAIDYALDKEDTDHGGGTCSVKLNIPGAAISGNLAVSNVDGTVGTDVIAFEKEQLLTATISSSGASGALTNAKMAISVPAGQKYVAGSAQIAYPSNMPVSVSPAYETYLTSLLTGGNETLFDFDFEATTGNPSALINGTGTSAQKEAVLTMKFEPNCDTKLTGIWYEGTLTGTSACGVAATGNGKKVYSTYQYPKLNFDYGFGETLTLTANKAVGPIDSKVTAGVSIIKSYPNNKDISITDSLELQMHKSFDLTSISFTDGSLGLVTVGSNIVSGNVRTIRVSYPAAIINGKTNNGVGFDTKYSLQLTYDPSKYATSDGSVQQLLASIVSNQVFDAFCSPSYATMVVKTADIGVVTFNPYPYILCPSTTGGASVNNFDGDLTYEWYTDKAMATTALSTGETVSFTAPALSDDTLYVKVKNTLSDLLGTIRYPYKTHPEATITITDPTAQCSATSSFDLTGTVSNTPALSTVKY
ncbi:MAG: hypothetical protein LBJ72_03750, partial [Dysgonamonadaceae bacterium]|nr:hypothetical protein [Dysgonamonadaceae bacterium]